MGLIKWIKSLCWHDWYYKKKKDGFSICIRIGEEKDFPWHMKGLIDRYYQRVCLKCGKCEDTYTKAYGKRSRYFNNRNSLGEKIWKDSCLKS